MKKVTTILLVLLLALSLFAGGGKESSSSSASDGAIRITWWGNQVRNNGTQEVINKYMELNPGVKIEAEFADWSSYWDKLATQAAGGMLPDIIQMDYYYILQYATSGQLASIDEYLDNGTINHDNIADSVIAAGEINGNCYAMSLGNTAYAFIYDKAIVDQAGVEIPLSPTVSDIKKISAEIYEKTGVPMYWQGGLEVLLNTARGNGSNIFEELAAGITDSSAIYFKNLEEFSKAPYHVSAELLAEKNVLVADQMPITDLTTWNAFTVSNGYTALLNACGGRELAICTYPILDTADENPVFFKPTMYFSITETSKHKEEAAKFIDWFVNSTEANAILNAERGVPINTEISAYISANLTPVDAVPFDYLTAITDIATPIDAPPPAGWAEVEATLLTYDDNIRYGYMTAEQATKEFVELSQSILKNAAN